LSTTDTPAAVGSDPVRHSDHVAALEGNGREMKRQKETTRPPCPSKIAVRLADYGCAKRDGNLGPKPVVAPKENPTDSGDKSALPNDSRPCAGGHAARFRVATQCKQVGWLLLRIC